MNGLLIFDQQLFLFLNHLPHNNLLNAIALFLSGVGTAGIIWLLLGVLLFFREEKKDHLFFIPLLLSGATCLVLVNKIFKPLVSRPRPDLEMGAIILGNNLADFSFPSGHAAIAWAGAILLSQKEPRLRWVFYTLAGAISLSRIYLGVHYPSDVLAGALFGCLLANITLGLMKGPKASKGQLSRSGKGRIR